MNKETYLKKYSGFEIPKSLKQLIEFSLENDPSFSNGFEFLIEKSENLLEFYSAEEKFLESFVSIGYADEIESEYAFWAKNGYDLTNTPIVAFGEGGIHQIVAKNFDELVRILTFDQEPLIDWGEISFLKDENDFESSISAKKFHIWFENIMKSSIITSNEEIEAIIVDAQEIYQSDLEKWISEFYEEFDFEIYVEKSLTRIEAINSYKGLFDFCRDFEQTSKTEEPEYNCPIWVFKGKKENQAIDQLKKSKYPNDFIEWHQSYGAFSLGFYSIKVISTQSVVEENESNYWSLLTHNNYTILTTDGSGNAYIANKNIDSEIKFIDHNNYLQINTIPDIYEEYYNFSIDDKSYNGEIDIDKVIDDNGEYILNSEYIAKYISEIVESTSYTSFFSFLKGKLDEGFRLYFGL